MSECRCLCHKTAGVVHPLPCCGEKPSVLRALLADNERLTDKLKVATVEANKCLVSALQWEERADSLDASLTAAVARADAAEAKVRAVERIHCWTNEDGRRFMFVDDVAVALGITSPEPGE